MKKEKRIVFLLGLASMINDTSSEAIYSILPYYIDNPALIGFFGGLFNGFGSILKIFFGYLSDYFGKRKSIIILGYSLSAIAKTFMAIASLPLLPVTIILDRVGKGVRDSPRDAILGTLKERGYAFGIHRALDTFGALFGTILAYIMLHYVESYRVAMLFAGGISFLTIMPLLFLPEFKVKRKKETFVHALKDLSSNVKKILIPTLLFGFSFISPMLFISESKGEFAIGAILLYTLYNISYILSSIYLGKRSDVYGRKKIIIIGGIFTVLSFISMYLASIFGKSILFVLTFLLYGLGAGSFTPAAFAYVGDSAKTKGTAMGVFQAVYGVAVFLSSTIFGIFLSTIGNIVFLIYSIFPFLAILRTSIK